ncbi:Mur ligase family protein [Cellulomonas sp. KRMCY2]|uniref:Mur ligase family protein n=1 Tax=Cellulomonas sp. KRMCY2 TaxID=1304865 RepID=UPI00045E9EBA|nr:Mur ligase family protein [Cellulomonas sp. KRMCY2]
MNAALVAVVVACSVAAVALAGVRWLRVAQREHYLAGRVSRIAVLWLSRSRLDLLLAVVAGLLAGAACVRSLAILAVPAAVLVVVLPRGLGVRGSTSALGWTARLRRLVAVWAVLELGIGTLLVWLLGPGALALLAVATPVTLDAALALMEIVERRLSAPFVAQAQRRLARVRPQVVAVTGSYGKTSTKGYIAHLLSASTAVVASPASFNNRLGLSRAVNDGLVDGTEVFVAEMGTYGPGEIRELCRLFPPDIAVITTIGEAHLERMRTTATVLAAKSEITERAGTVVLPVDAPELAALAERCRAAGKRVVTCTVAGVLADVSVDLAGGLVTLVAPDGTTTTHPVGAGVAHAVNLAVALGVVLAVGADRGSLTSRLRSLPRAAHRAELQDTGTGLLVIDDTYNANPIGARAALAEAGALAKDRDGTLVVVTPGIVELGPVQAERNAEFARAAAQAGAHLVVVGRTNRAALVAGAQQGDGTFDVVDQRAQAVPLATAKAGPAGVILYENDLPDHYP